jgi:hypothetical protein
VYVAGTDRPQASRRVRCQQSSAALQTTGPRVSSVETPPVYPDPVPRVGVAHLARPVGMDHQDGVPARDGVVVEDDSVAAAAADRIGTGPERMHPPAVQVHEGQPVAVETGVESDVAHGRDPTTETTR